VSSSPEGIFRVPTPAGTKLSSISSTFFWKRKKKGRKKEGKKDHDKDSAMETQPC